MDERTDVAEFLDENKLRSNQAYLLKDLFRAWIAFHHERGTSPTSKSTFKALMEEAGFEHLDIRRYVHLIRREDGASADGTNTFEETLNRAVPNPRWLQHQLGIALAETTESARHAARIEAALHEAYQAFENVLVLMDYATACLDEVNRSGCRPSDPDGTRIDLGAASRSVIDLRKRLKATEECILEETFGRFFDASWTTRPNAARGAQEES